MTTASGIVANGHPTPGDRLKLNQRVLSHFRRMCGVTQSLEVSVRGPEHAHTADTHFAGPLLYVGSDPRNDVSLSGPGINRRHAYLQVIGDRVYCVDLGSRTGLHWEGKRRAAGWTEFGTEIGIGPYSVRVSPARSPTETPDSPISTAEGTMTGPSVLEVQSDNECPVEWTVADGVSLLGRATSCAFRVADPHLDAYHFALVRTGGELWVVDLRSGRQTCVNGRNVQLARLKDGDVLQAGSWTAVARCPELSQPSQALVRSTAAVRAPETRSDAEPMVPVAPFQQMMEQFQQCMSMMGQMFTTLQQQHMMMVREQINQIREVSRELLDRQIAPADLPWASPVEIPWACEEAYNLPGTEPPRDLPSPSLAGGDQSHELWNAHAWFTDRLADLGDAKTRR